MFRCGVKSFAGLASMALALAIAGCKGGSADVDPVKRAGDIAKPETVVIRDFSVVPGDMKLDKETMAAATRDAKNGTPNEMDQRVGRVFADRLASALVEELRSEGISALREKMVAQTFPNTAYLNGQFITKGAGGTTIGFGIAEGHIHARVQVSQAGKVVAEAETSSTTTVNKEMIGPAGTGLNAGIPPEVNKVIEGDARRLARAIADKVKRAYVDRGWMK